MAWTDDVERILFSEEELKKRVEELGRQITEDYRDKNLLVVGILKGAVPFCADLFRTIDLPAKMDFIGVSSYGAGAKSSGAVRFLKDLDTPVQGVDILIVEDIVDTGLTLRYLMENLLARDPASVKICCLLDKPERRKTEVAVDYVGFEIPNEFVIGYGLDYNEQYRNLPYVAVLSPRAYE